MCDNGESALLPIICVMHLRLNAGILAHSERKTPTFARLLRLINVVLTRIHAHAFVYSTGIEIHHIIHPPLPLADARHSRAAPLTDRVIIRHHDLIIESFAGSWLMDCRPTAFIARARGMVATGGSL